MITAGCDIGSLTAKAVILDSDTIAASAVIRSRPQPEDSAVDVMRKALEKAGLEQHRVERCFGTGYGRNRIPFADDVESEILCHGTGAIWLLPSVRMVIDVGGQDAKAIRMDDKGNILRYVYNDKCASGTGRFLEIMANALDIDFEEMGTPAYRSSTPVGISNQCVVFAETEIISLVNAGRDIPDIVSGLHRAMAHRIASLARGIDPEEDITMTGGVAKNEGMFSALQEAIGLRVQRVPCDPQIVGALGAAVLAARTG